MSADITSETPAPPQTARTSWRAALMVYLQPRVLIVAMLGFSAGLPLALSGSTLLMWMSEAGVSLSTIGLFTLVGQPYVWKFLWSPLVDSVRIPVLSRLLGRRRGWLVFTQIMLMVAIFLLAFTDPVGAPFLVALGAFTVATVSATQDIVIDAFRVESLTEQEQAAGMASYVAAYRVAMVVSGAGALFIVTGFEYLGFSKLDAWQASFAVMALLVSIGIVTVLVAREPADSARVVTNEARSTVDRIFANSIAAFMDFLTRRDVIVVLLFVLLFKLTDAFAGAMTIPFIVDIGYTRVDYAVIVKGVGLIATLAGGFAGGFLARACPLSACLWIGGILQAISNLTFSWLALLPPTEWALSIAVTVESFTGAIGTVIFVAYLSALCKNPLHTATQYALLSALTAVGRVYLPAVSGFVAQSSGWPLFFAISVVVALPSFVLLAWLQMRGHFENWAKVTN